MLLNPIPWNSYDSEVYLSRYIFFSIIAILAITFIIGTLLALRYNKHQRLAGKIFVAIGILEMSTFIIPIIISATGYAGYFLSPDNPFTNLSILGCITLTGGVASIKQEKHHWLFFLIFSAIIMILWTFYGFFITFY
jgi:hypothetical protein